MSKLILLAAAAMLACGSAYAAENAQQNKMKMCQTQAGEKKLEGQARQDYVNNCLKAKPAAEKPKSKMAMCNEKTAGMKAEERAKAQSECMKAS
jgi:psiF repeat